MPLLVAELETLFTANVDQVEKAEKQIKATGQRVEKNPLKVDADAKSALASMGRVEDAAKRIVSKDTVARVDANIARGEKNLARIQGNLDYLHSVETELDVSADIRRAEASLSKVERNLDGLRNARTHLEVEADPDDALADMARVEEAAKQLVSLNTAVRINANIKEAQSAVDEIEAELDYLRSIESTVQVDANIRQAESKLAHAKATLKGLDGARATMVVDVNEGGAKRKLQSVESVAADAGDDAGEAFGDNIVAALATIPVAGAVVGIGVAAGKALLDGLKDGLQAEARVDRIQALTGVDEREARRLGRIAGEAYASNFGESIEANMDTARLATQFDIIDADTSNREAQKVIEGLSGIADALDDDVKPTSTAVTTLLRTGMARSAEHAFDLLATGAREGLNRNEDLLDTLTEYPSVLSKLGLSGDEALGLLSQSMQAGARNTDVAADALKEFQIRATDGSKASSEGFALIGLSAGEMTAKIAAGGSSAKEGLAEVLTKLRETEDPVQRNAAAVALFGTKAEDLGDALFAMDLSNAVTQLNGVEGAAKSMFDTLAGNDAANIETAQRNIEVAADGIKGALAAAFSEPLGEFAAWVSENRGPLTRFLLDLGIGALDMAEGFVTGAADSIESFALLAGFVAESTAVIIDHTADVITAMDNMVPGDQGAAEFREWADKVNEGLTGVDDVALEVADTMRTEMVSGVQEARDRLSEWGEPIVQMGYVHDASMRAAGAVDAVGLAADGATPLMDGFTISNDGAVQASTELEGQIRNALAALGEEIAVAGRAGEGQAALTERYNAATGALVGQLTQMGLTEEQARSLIDTVLKTPPSATTTYGSNAVDQQRKVEDLAYRIVTLPDGSTHLKADTRDAESKLDDAARSRESWVIQKVRFGGHGMHDGGVLEFMASGGLTPMQPVAQMVPANTWRVVGDRGDVAEAYIPLDGSARSMAILLETMRRMGVEAMANGGITKPEPRSMMAPVGPAFVNYGTIHTDPSELVAKITSHQHSARSKWSSRVRVP